MKRSVSIVLTIVLAVAIAGAGDDKKEAAVSFKTGVFPIIKAKCLPCHAEDNFNPSELSLDSYDALAAGGKNGVPFKAGKSRESLLIQKLGEKPPFGDRMPLNSKKKIAEGKAVWLSADELKTIATWIDQGAKNN
jgi:hypothetical protein